MLFFRSMKYFLLLFIAFTARAEQGMSQQDMQFIQMMQEKAEREQREQEFKEPKKPKIDKDRAVSGDRNAKILIVAYSDFECPYCSKGAENLEVVRKKYGSKVGFVFKHLPLPFHSMAQPAAEYFEAIALQSSKAAYKFHDMVFKEQHRLKDEGLKFLDEVAKKAGADLAKVKANLKNEKVQAHINQDREEAKKFGISGTPGFVVAGVTVKGAYPPEEFYAIIDRRLKSKK